MPGTRQTTGTTAASTAAASTTAAGTTTGTRAGSSAGAGVSRPRGRRSRGRDRSAAWLEHRPPRRARAARQRGAAGLHRVPHPVPGVPAAHQPLPGLHDTTAVALVVALAAVGGGVGTVLGGALRRIRPEGVVVAALAVTVGRGRLGGAGLRAVAGVRRRAGRRAGQSLGKLCLDALIQGDVPEQVRTSAFARSETVLQLAWVVGGGVGLVLPLSGAWGLGIAARGDHSRRRRPWSPRHRWIGLDRDRRRAAPRQSRAAEPASRGAPCPSAGQASRSSATARSTVATLWAVDLSG